VADFIFVRFCEEVTSVCYYSTRDENPPLSQLAGLPSAVGSSERGSIHDQVMRMRESLKREIAVEGSSRAPFSTPNIEHVRQIYEKVPVVLTPFSLACKP
jgi:hypothetical protein